MKWLNKVRQTKVIKATATATTVELTRHHTCQDKNIVYIVECSKCRKQYIGETKHSAEHRCAEHLGAPIRLDFGQL